MKEYEGILSPYIGRGTWKNFKPIPLGGSGGKNTIGEGIGKRKDMKHVNMQWGLSFELFPAP